MANRHRTDPATGRIVAKNVPREETGEPEQAPPAVTGRPDDTPLTRRDAGVANSTLASRAGKGDPLPASHGADDRSTLASRRARGKQVEGAENKAVKAADRG